MDGATRKSEHMSKEDAMAWRDSVLENFSARLGTELPDRFAEKFVGSKNLLSIYSGVIEDASRDVWREIFFVARDPASKIAPAAESAARGLEKCYSELVDSARKSVETGDLRALKEHGYRALIEAGAIVAEVREESEPYKAGRKETEQENIETYVEMLLRAQEKAHPLA